MAGTSLRVIKNRIRSMESTRQITRAMELAASSRLRRAQSQEQCASVYAQVLGDAMADVLQSCPDQSSPFFVRRDRKRVLRLVIAGDRGLAGGYNSNILKLAAESEERDALFLPIGRKALDHFSRQGLPIFTDAYSSAAAMTAGDCFSLAEELCRIWRAGEFGDISICYTRFHSVLTQSPTTAQLFPLQCGTPARNRDLLLEPDPKQVLDAIVPDYLGAMLYNALCQSRAAEQAARRIAMESATSNAEERIDDLRLTFNRTRQAAITRQITEITAGT